MRLLVLVGALVLALLPNLGTPAVASPRASGEIVANEVSQPWPTHRPGSLTLPSGAPIDAADAGSTGGATLLFSSEPIAAGQLFDRVGVHWIAARGAEETLYVEVRVSSDGAAWSDWVAVREEEDMTNEYLGEHFAAPLGVAASRYAQYRVWLTSGDPDAITRVNVTFMDVTDLNAGPVARLLNDVIGAFSDLGRSFADAAPVGSSRILTRQDWAADEKLMQWPPKYQRVQKFVIHHTVTDDGGSNVAATIRSIYYYHAVTRGWGDIGYNYLVDKFGNIWTGRQGGDHVIGGHAYGWNNGSVGIAALGDYSVTAPTGQLQGAIANIIAMKSAQFGIQPYGNDSFKHQEQAPDGTWVDIVSTPPNIQGHRDCNYILSQHGGQTSCPGSGIYNMLDGLRRLAQNAVVSGYVDMPYIDPQLPKAAYPGQTINVAVSVSNKGQTTIPAGTAVSYRLLSKGALTLAQGAVGILGTAIPPGSIGVANVPFPVPALGSYVARWDLQTNGAWWNTLKGSPVRDLWFNSAEWSADWVSDNVPIAWVAGETRQISVTVTNDGGRAWPAAGVNPVRLGYKWVSNATGNIFPGAVRMNLPYDVQPGQTVTLQIPVVAPVYPTNYTMYLDLYKENEFAFADKGVAPDDTPTGVSVDFKAQYGVPPAAFTAGQSTNVPVTITNSGKGTYPVTSSYPVDLGFHWYTAAGQTVLWDGPRTKFTADLGPGQSATLTVPVLAPAQGGAYQLRFDLVQEGVSWFSQKGVATGNLSVNVAGPVVPVYGASYEPGVSTLAMSGTSVTVPITVRNTSNFVWPAAGANPITLSYHWSSTTGATVVWDGIRTRLAADVPAGASALLQANLAFPSTPGSYVLRWDLVQEGKTWFSGQGVKTLDVPVAVSAFVEPFYGGSIDPTGTPASLPARLTTPVAIRVQNLSNFDFGADVNISYHWYDSSGKTVVWDGVRTSLAGLRQNEVRPVSVAVQAPPSAGSYTLRFDMVREGLTWFSSQGMMLAPNSVNVVVPAYGAIYAVPGTVTGAANATVAVPVGITNTGTTTWTPGAFNLAYHLYAASGNVYVWEGLRTALTQPVAPGATLTLNANVKMPASGTFTLKFDLVQEGLTWFSGANVPTGNASLSVQ
jgi:hypothetical protein